MAEQIAQDPGFAQMAQAMQQNMNGAQAQGVSGINPPGGMPAGLDPAAYTNMMSGVMQNPQFVEMAEKLGQQIMQACLHQPAGTCPQPVFNIEKCQLYVPLIHVSRNYVLSMCSIFLLDSECV